MYGVARGEPGVVPLSFLEKLKIFSNFAPIGAKNRELR
jgi:hypothetical protein